MHALLRSAISLRRGNKADSYRRSLGVIAYADSFQRHLGGWSNERGVAVNIKNRMDYDFGALKASIESSLKVKELSDQVIRGRLLFAFGTFITALTIVSPILREYLPEVPPDQQPGKNQIVFIDLISWMGQNPIVTLIAAIFVGFSIDWGVTLIAYNRYFTNFGARCAQILDYGLAWFSDRLRLGSWLTKLIVLVILAAGLIAVGLAWLQVFREAGFDISELF